jgi:hypothetical protein
MITVHATREGLTGAVTASGYHIDRVVPFVALPATRALGKFVRVANPANGRVAYAVVLDVGPWNEQDDAYVFQPATQRVQGMGVDASVPPEVRPAAESGIDTRGRPTNGAGIDLGERIWHALGMTDNAPVAWEFL